MAAHVEIHKLSEIRAKNPRMIVGFPGAGLVGSVAASQLLDAWETDFVGYITSPSFAPLAAIHEYVPQPPVRIHYSKEHNTLIIISEMSVPVGASSELAEKIFEFAKSVGVSEIVSLGGISMKEEENAVYVVASDKKIAKNLISKRNVKQIREGATTGVIGILLSKGVLENFPVVSILAEAAQDYLDPRAAANSLKILSEYLGVQINTARLEKEAKELTESIKEATIRAKIPKKEGGAGGMYG